MGQLYATTLPICKASIFWLIFLAQNLVIFFLKGHLNENLHSKVMAVYTDMYAVLLHFIRNLYIRRALLPLYTHHNVMEHYSAFQLCEGDDMLSPWH